MTGKMFAHALVKDSFQILHVCSLFSKYIMSNILLILLYAVAYFFIVAQLEIMYNATVTHLLINHKFLYMHFFMSVI